jgi:hypothetical protein
MATSAFTGSARQTESHGRGEFGVRDSANAVGSKEMPVSQ